MNRFFSCILLFAALIGCKEESTPNPQDPGWGDNDKSKQFSVMSYNIRHCAPYYGNSENTTADVNGVANVIKKIKPDLVFLQEVDKNTTRSLGIDQAKKIAELVGYPHYQFFKMMDYQGGEYGMAILSGFQIKEPITYSLPGIIDGVTIGGNNTFGSVKINFAGKEILLVVTHLSVYQTERDKQLPYFLDNYLSKWTGTTLFAGDFNATPDNLTMQTLTKDGFSRTNYVSTNYTIPSTAPNREIDYITYKPSAQFEVVSHMVMTGYNASDHLPIVSVLKINN